MYMAKYDKYELPEDIFEFAFIPKFYENIKELAEMAEPEDWGYKKQNLMMNTQY